MVCGMLALILLVVGRIAALHVEVEGLQEAASQSRTFYGSRMFTERRPVVRFLQAAVEDVLSHLAAAELFNFPEETADWAELGFIRAFDNKDIPEVQPRISL